MISEAEPSQNSTGQCIGCLAVMQDKLAVDDDMFHALG